MAGFVGPITSTKTGVPLVVLNNLVPFAVSAAEFAIIKNQGIEGTSQVYLDITDLDVVSGRITDIVIERIKNDYASESPALPYPGAEPYVQDKIISGVNITTGNDQSIGDLRVETSYNQQANGDRGLLWYYRISFLNANGEIAVDGAGAPVYVEQHVYCNGKPDSKEMFEVLDLSVNGTDGDITLGIDGKATLSWPDIRTKTVADYNALAVGEEAHWGDGAEVGTSGVTIEQTYIDAVDHYVVFMGVLINNEQWPNLSSTNVNWFQLETIPAGSMPQQGSPSKVTYEVTPPLDKTVFYWVAAITPVTEMSDDYDAYQHPQQ